MIIRKLGPILENLVELENDIQQVEKLLEDLGIEIDREGILRALVNRKKEESFLRQKN